MKRETATTKYDLPHEFEGGVLRGVCRCGAELASELHAVSLLQHPREQASASFRIQTEKGS